MSTERASRYLQYACAYESIAYIVLSSSIAVHSSFSVHDLVYGDVSIA